MMPSSRTSPPTAAPLSLALAAASACPPNSQPLLTEAFQVTAAVEDEHGAKVLHAEPGPMPASPMFMYVCLPDLASTTP